MVAPQVPPSQPAGSPEVPPILLELDQRDFALWRRHPITELVLERYLPFYRERLEREIMERWLAGPMEPHTETRFRSAVAATLILQNLSLGMIRDAYGLPVEQPR